MLRFIFTTQIIYARLMPLKVLSMHIRCFFSCTLMLFGLCLGYVEEGKETFLDQNWVISSLK